MSFIFGILCVRESKKGGSGMTLVSGTERCLRCGRIYKRDLSSVTHICPSCRAKEQAVKKILGHIWKK